MDVILENKRYQQMKWSKGRPRVYALATKPEIAIDRYMIGGEGDNLKSAIDSDGNTRDFT